MRQKHTWIPAAAALLVVAGFLVPLSAEDLAFEMVEGEWIALHVWLPPESVSAILPEHFKPGRFRIDVLEDRPPGTMADAYLIIRRGNFRLPLAGKTVDEADVLDMMIIVAVRTPPSQQIEGTSDFYLLDYATSNQLLVTLLRDAGIQARSLDGTLSNRTLPSTQQEAQANLNLAGYEPWNIVARSTGGTHFDLGNRTWRIFFGDAQQALTISLRDDFYMRAVSRISGFHENTPLEGFGDWRWADSDTLLIYTSGSDHSIGSIQNDSQQK